MAAASVRIAARQPLLRAGLERIARAAGVDLLDSPAADLVLRAFDTAPAESGIDVAIADGTIVITCRTQPAAGVWDALRRIVDAAAS